jgi:hypothetical protein
MKYRKGDLSKLVLRSLTSMRLAKTQFLPLSTDLPNAAALAVQIKVRDDFLCNIRKIRVSLGRRITQSSSARRRASAPRKNHGAHRARGGVGIVNSGVADRNAV